MKYLRLYADSDGESRFEDVDIELNPVDFAPPAAPVNLSAFNPATQCGFLSVPAKWYGAPHPAPVKAIYVFISGEWEITTSDGQVRRLSPGSIVRAEDTTGKGHSSRLLSDSEGFAAVVQLAD
jgi:hypothetical protein